MVQSLTLHKTQQQYLKDIGREGMDARSFVYSVCPRATTLPLPKLGQTLHYPMAYYNRGRWEWGWPPDAVRSRIDYLIVMPDVQRGSSLEGQSFAVTNRVHEIVHDGLEQAGIPIDRLGVTYAARYIGPTGHKPTVSTLDACRPFVQGDIEYLRPKVILALGGAAVKAVLGKAEKLSSIRGSVVMWGYGEYEIPVVATDSPKSFLSGYADIGVFHRELRRGRDIVDGEGLPSEPSTAGYRVCWARDEVQQLVDDIRHSGAKQIAIDCEWGNDFAREEYSYTLSIQLCWAKGQAAFIALRGEGGCEIHDEQDYQAILNMVEDLLSPDDIQLIGHHLRVDVNQLHKLGMKLDHKVRTGFCTMLVHHLIHNDSPQGLDTLVRKYCPAFGAFWHDLESWLDRSRKRKVILRHGFRDIPYDILIPYAQRDADATYHAWLKLKERIKLFPKQEKLYWSISAPCALHLMDVERQGVLIDEERRRSIRAFYLPIKDFYAEKVRQAFNWPDMNVASHAQVKSMLFQGIDYSDAKAAPEGTRPLSLYPVCNTDKHPKAWSEIEAEGKSRFNSPSTKAESLDLLYHQNQEHEVLVYLKHFSVVNKLLTAYLTIPETNEYGVLEDGDSLGHNIEEDGRARTSLSQITNTGRYTSKKPNLQTWPKKQEAALLAAVVFYKWGLTLKEYQIKVDQGELDELKIPSVKGCVIAPAGKKLIEIDFQTAEVNTWAFASGDRALLKVVQLGRDLHSENTVNAFNLPEKAELPDLLAKLEAGDREPYSEWKARVADKYSALRIAAKSIIFGIMYGRGARALAREISKTGVEITVEQCEAIINAVAASYPKAWAMLQDAARSAVENGWVENVFGRRRCFTGVANCSNADIASAKRQAQNFVIQSAVADLLAQAGATLYEFRYETEIGRKLDFKILLPVHDAFLIEVDEDKVDKVVKAFEIFMGKHNKIPGTNHYLGVDVEVRDRWGK